MISIHLCNFPFQLFDATMTSREGYGQQNWYEQVKCNKPYHHANFDIDHIWRCLRKSQHQGFCYNLDGLTNKYFLLQVKQQTQLKLKKKKNLLHENSVWNQSVSHSCFQNLQLFISQLSKLIQSSNVLTRRQKQKRRSKEHYELGNPNVRTHTYRLQEHGSLILFSLTDHLKENGSETDGFHSQDLVALCGIH